MNFSPINTKPHTPHTLQIALAILLVGFGLASYQSENTLLSETPLEEASLVNPYENIELEGVSALVWDVSREETLYGKNETTQLPLASLVKMLTAVVALETIDKSETVAISRDALYEEGDSGFLIGERWGLQSLIELTLMTSSNDGAAALAEAVSSHLGEDDQNVDNIFSHKALEVIHEAGMDQTYIINSSGLDVSEAISGAYGSAQDVAKLFAYTLKKYPEVLEGTTYQKRTVASLDDIIHEATNTNEIIDLLPAVIGSKTGYTDLAGGNLAVMFDAGLGRPLVAVVLGSSREGRFSDVEKLIWATFGYLEYAEGRPRE